MLWLTEANPGLPQMSLVERFVTIYVKDLGRRRGRGSCILLWMININERAFWRNIYQQILSVWFDRGELTKLVKRYHRKLWFLGNNLHAYWYMGIHMGILYKCFLLWVFLYKCILHVYLNYIYICILILYLYVNCTISLYINVYYMCIHVFCITCINSYISNEMAQETCATEKTICMICQKCTKEKLHSLVREHKNSSQVITRIFWNE